MIWLRCSLFPAAARRHEQSDHKDQSAEAPMTAVWHEGSDHSANDSRRASLQRCRRGSESRTALAAYCSFRESPVARMIRNPFLSEIDPLPKQTPKPAAQAATPKKQEPGSACRVALIGFGTVGRAVAKILSENRDGRLRLTHICNRNVEKKKQALNPNDVPGDVIWTDDVDSVLNSDVQIVIEL